MRNFQTFADVATCRRRKAPHQASAAASMKPRVQSPGTGLSMIRRGGRQADRRSGGLNFASSEGGSK